MADGTKLVAQTPVARLTSVMEPAQREQRECLIKAFSDFVERKTSYADREQSIRSTIARRCI